MTSLKNHFKYLPVLLPILIVISGCEKEEATFNVYEIWDCHKEKIRDYHSTKNEVIGLWAWSFGYCCGDVSNVYENSSEFKGLMIEFDDDNTGIYSHENDTIHFTWDIDPVHEYFDFKTDPFISQLHGYIMFCNDIMMCNGAVTDGADNYFERIE